MAHILIRMIVSLSITVEGRGLLPQLPDFLLQIVLKQKQLDPFALDNKTNCGFCPVNGTVELCLNHHEPVQS